MRCASAICYGRSNCAISQQHEQIAEQTLEQAIRAIEQSDYRPGVIAIERELKVRRP